MATARGDLGDDRSAVRPKPRAGASHGLEYARRVAAISSQTADLRRRQLQDGVEAAPLVGWADRHRIEPLLEPNDLRARRDARDFVNAGRRWCLLLSRRRLVRRKSVRQARRRTVVADELRRGLSGGARRIGRRSNTLLRRRNYRL